MASSVPGMNRRVVLIAAAALLTIASAVAAGPAQAATVHNESANAASGGPVVEDSSGNGYLTWNAPTVGGNKKVEFCKVPAGGTCAKSMTLGLPTGAMWGNYDLLNPFPILGAVSGTVMVVDPSYIYDTVAVWTSTNGGASFSRLKLIPSPVFANNTGDDDVLLALNTLAPADSDFSIASHNPGLGYTFTGVGAIGAPNPPEGFKLDTDSVSGGVAGATLGYGTKATSTTEQTIEAFWTDADTPTVDVFWSPLPGVSGGPGSLEHGPYKVSDGFNARLAGGPGGLYLLTEDLGTTSADALHLNVRKWDSTTHRFGKATLVGKVPAGAAADDQGGFTEDASTGALSVVWPVQNTGDAYRLRLWTSTNGATSFSAPKTLTALSHGFEGPVRVATYKGSGFATYQDDNGLELIDLTHVTPS
jgi:hypothetical protein